MFSVKILYYNTASDDLRIVIILNIFLIYEAIFFEQKSKHVRNLPLKHLPRFLSINSIMHGCWGQCIV